MNARPGWNGLGLGLLAACLAAPVLALPPADADPAALLRFAEPVTSIPVADSVQGFEPLDNEHVVLSTGGENHYLLTLERECFGLRWARHVGITASGNTIWVGFDALTADGEACSIREIHRLREPQGSSL
jgi:hypothetical protein